MWLVVNQGTRKIFGYICHLYIGLVALSLNQSTRKTSAHPAADCTSQGNTAVVPWSPFTCDTGTGKHNCSNFGANKYSVFFNGATIKKVYVRQV